MRILFAAMAALLLAPSALAQTPTPVTSSPAPKDDLVRVVLDTDAGRIVVALDRGRAPLTVANFLRYVDGKKFDGESFYRAMPYGDGGLIQAGITSDTRKLLPTIEHEPTSKTGIKHLAGTLSMARAEPGTARSDFFILTTDIPGFDAASGQPGDDLGFAAFGRVVEGMDVVKRIFATPVSPTKGEGALKGEMLEPAIKIRTARREP